MADKQITPRCYYDEEARAKLRKHIERVGQQREVARDVDWDVELWQTLEASAALYERWAADPKVTARNALNALTRCAVAIDKLRGCLMDPALLNWSAVSSSGLSFQAESPELRELLVEELAELQNEYETDARELRVVLSGAGAKKKTSATHPEAWLVRVILDIGHQLFGPQVVGYEEGPLIKFLQLALEPVLGSATPSAEALRTIARREGDGQHHKGMNAC